MGDTHIAYLSHEKDFTIKLCSSKNEYPLHHFFYSTYILGVMRLVLKKQTRQTSVFWKTLTSKYFHIAPMFSYA